MNIINQAQHQPAVVMQLVQPGVDAEVMQHLAAQGPIVADDMIFADNMYLDLQHQPAVVMQPIQPGVAAEVMMQYPYLAAQGPIVADDIDNMYEYLDDLPQWDGDDHVLEPGSDIKK